jgi:hypothetical protein
MKIGLFFKVVLAVIVLTFSMGCGNQRALSEPDRGVVQRGPVLASDAANTLLVVRGSRIAFHDSPLDYFFNATGRGPVSSVDMFDPLKPLIYFQRQQRLVTLDNTLSLQSEIDMLTVGFENTALVCRSFSNHFWVYDENLNELIRTDHRFSPVARTGNLSLFFSDITIGRIREKVNTLYVLSPGRGIMLFDLFARHIRTFEAPDVIAFDVWQNELFLLSAGGILSVLDMQSLESKELLMPTGLEPIDLAVLKTSVALADEGKLTTIQRP